MTKLNATLSSRAFWTALAASLAVAAPILNHVEPASVNNLLAALSPLLLWAGGLAAQDAAAAHGKSHAQELTRAKCPHCNGQLVETE